MYEEHKAMVRQFQETFHQPVNLDEKTFNAERINLRRDLQKEEETELLDALVDIAYIVLGTSVECKTYDEYARAMYFIARDIAYKMFHSKKVFDIAFKRVQEANMDKLENGNPLVNGVTTPLDESKPYGKVMKRKGWIAPDLSDLV